MMKLKYHVKENKLFKGWLKNCDETEHLSASDFDLLPADKYDIVSERIYNQLICGRKI